MFDYILSDIENSQSLEMLHLNIETGKCSLLNPIPIACLITTVNLGNIFDIDLAEGQFDFIFDKGLFDCILSGYSSQKKSAEYLQKVYRSLSPGGTYFYVTNGRPSSKLEILKVCFLNPTHGHWNYCINKSHIIWNHI